MCARLTGLFFNELLIGHHLISAIKSSYCELCQTDGKALELLMLAYRNEQSESPAEVQEEPSRKESISEKGKYSSKWNLKSA